jgi:23S rRNA (uracil1939-C5)-methyltransferase
VVVGFRERLKPYVAELQSCAVLASPVNALMEPLARLIEKLTIRDDLPQIEVAVADNAAALVLRVLKPPSAADLALLATFAAQHAVRFYMQPGGLETIEPLDETACEPLRYRLPAQELQFEFGPSDFIQINAEVNRQLVSAAVELLAPRSDSTVLDLFCGLGNFTLPVARHCRDAVGVDGDAALVARARLNAVHNAITNVAFHAANLFEPQSGAAWRARRYSHVLLDPPRAGAQQLLAEIAAMAPERIVYVSCHPGTLARDTGILVHGHGFELHAAGVIDMFPHTSHLESIVMLEPRARRQAGARP